jgi:hypothetical protein
MASCLSLSVMVRSTLRVLGDWRGSAVQEAEDVVGDRLGLFEVQGVPCAGASPTFVMYRSSTAMKPAVARIARMRPGLAGLEGVATPGGAEEFKGMGCPRSRQACTHPVR